MLKIGIIREGKVPPDFRVPLTPKQCREIREQYGNQIDITVQTSPIRTFKDNEYEENGIKIVQDLSDRDLIIGVKEVQIHDLIPNKTFMFFSHTYKEQPYNRALLQAILAKKISLIDYEMLRNREGKRVIGFGRYAGIVGTYNGFRTWGKKMQSYDLVRAVETNDRNKVEQELQKVVLPKDFRMVLTGFGRVGHGAREILALLPIKEVAAEEFLTKDFDEPVFTQLNSEQYYRRKSDNQFDKQEFYSNPSLYEAFLTDYLEKADMYIPCHLWPEHNPILVTAADLKNDLKRLKVIADISCDIKEPVASTIRPSEIANPIYGYNRQTEQEDDFLKEGIIAVMAVDNLPCELPKDASIDFGTEWINNVLPELLSENESRVIEDARMTDFEGNLTERYKYLTEYITKLVE